MTRSRRPKSHSAFKQIFASSRCEPLECRRLLSGVADTWTGAGVNSLFSNPANWQGNVAPTSGQDVDFPAAVSNTTVSIDGNMTIGNIEFDAGYTLSSANTITLAGNVTDTVGDVTIDNPIVLGQPVTFLTFDAAKITLNGIISDGGNALGIDKQGNGGLLLAGTGDTYTGQTTGDGGVLIDTAPLASHIGIHVGTTFYGSSSVAAIDGYDGSFNPQTIDTSTQTTAPATLTVNSGIDFTSPSGATMDYEIDGPMQSSQVVVNGGTIDLADTTLSTTVVNGYVPSPGDIITLVQNNTGEPITGTFLNLPQGATTTIDGKPYTISYTGGADHNSVTLMAPAAAANPEIISAPSSNSTHGYTISSAVVATDDTAGGTAGLTYTWSTIHLVPGAKAPTFSTNGTHASSSVTTRFYKDGTYIIRCTVTDKSGNVAVADELAVVSQKATSLKIEPHRAKIDPGKHDQYTTTLLDQFGHPMRVIPDVAYSVPTGGGTINSAGLFTAGNKPQLIDIEARADGLTGIAAATIV